MAEGAAPAAAAANPAMPAVGDQKDGDVAAGSEKPRQEPRGGIISRLWKGLFGPGDDFEKLLQHLTKEEAAVHTRLEKRALSWQKTSRNVIAVSVMLEVVSVAYAIIKTRESNLSWQLRAIYVLPMFLLPGFSALLYSALVSFTRMLDNKDKKALERLRAARQAKIDELKEKTNYYTTQQLIQKYDIDLAAKAAAATVLATKLGLDSGLKVYVGNESGIDASYGRINDVDLMQSTGLRNRKPSHVRASKPGSFPATQSVNETRNAYADYLPEHYSPAQEDVQHPSSSGPSNSAWLARIAALLVGEDPTQCYALICSNCYMHNGLARKEDFSYVTYYCPHCQALNGSRRSEEHGEGSVTEKDVPMSTSESTNTMKEHGENKLKDEINDISLPETAAANDFPAVEEQTIKNDEVPNQLAS